MAQLSGWGTSPAEALSWILLRGGEEWPRSEIVAPEGAKLRVDAVDGTFAERAGTVNAVVKG